MTGNLKTFGAGGETAAAKHLEGLGYRIVARNVRPIPGMARGEIDIVAWDRATLVFVEVKTRRSSFGSSGAPVEAINYAKRRQLTLLANAYIGMNHIKDVSCRFDVVVVIPQSDSTFRCDVIRNAFDGVGF